MTPGFTSGAICGRCAHASNADNKNAAAVHLPPNSFMNSFPAGAITSLA
jgi:hypothetical protein